MWWLKLKSAHSFGSSAVYKLLEKQIKQIIIQLYTYNFYTGFVFNKNLLSPLYALNSDRLLKETTTSVQVSDLPSPKKKLVLFTYGIEQSPDLCGTCTLALDIDLAHCDKDSRMLSRTLCCALPHKPWCPHRRSRYSFTCFCVNWDQSSCWRQFHSCKMGAAVLIHKVGKGTGIVCMDTPHEGVPHCLFHCHLVQIL
jgi:hypothetical protein